MPEEVLPLSRPADPRVRYPAQRTTSRRQRQHVFVILLLVSVPVLSCAEGGRGAPRSQEHRVLPKLFPFVISFDNHARAKIRASGKPSGIAQAWMSVVCKTLSKIFRSNVSCEYPNSQNQACGHCNTGTGQNQLPRFGLPFCRACGTRVSIHRPLHQTRSSWLCQQLKDRRPQ